MKPRWYIHYCCNITLPPSLCFPYGVFCLYVSLFLSSNEKKWDQISLSRWPDRLNQWTEKKNKKKKANPRSKIKFTSKPYRMTRIQQQHTHTPRYDGTSITNVHNECPIIDDQKKKNLMMMVFGVVWYKDFKLVIFFSFFFVSFWVTYDIQSKRKLYSFDNFNYWIFVNLNFWKFRPDLWSWSNIIIIFFFIQFTLL